MNPTNKVQTREVIDEAVKVLRHVAKYGKTSQGGEEWGNAEHCFFVADKLDSVILPEGKRFEVGDEALAVVDGDERNGTIEFVTHYQQVINLASKDVRPRPQTVELTDDEKLHEVEQAMKKRSEDSAIAVVRDLAKQLTGKTLDQLCKEYGVPTTREIP